MDCCNYGQYGAGAGAGAAWDYAPPPYAPYAHGYYAPAHDPYARYYRLDYPHHMHHAEPHMPMGWYYIIYSYDSNRTTTTRNVNKSIFRRKLLTELKDKTLKLEGIRRIMLSQRCKIKSV